MLHYNQRNLRTECSAGSCLDQLHIHGSERSVGLDFDLVSGFDNVGVMQTLVKVCLNNRPVNSKCIRKGVVLNAEHFQKDPHCAAFCRFCPSSLKTASGRIPSFTDHAKPVTGLHELG